jgi:hypothetical protein
VQENQEAGILFFAVKPLFFPALFFTFYNLPIMLKLLLHYTTNTFIVQVLVNVSKRVLDGRIEV